MLLLLYRLHIFCTRSNQRREKQTKKRESSPFFATFGQLSLQKATFLEQLLSNYLRTFGQLLGNLEQLLASRWIAFKYSLQWTRKCLIGPLHGVTNKKITQKTYYTGYYPNKLKDGIVISRHHQHRIQTWRQLQLVGMECSILCQKTCRIHEGISSIGWTAALAISPSFRCW